MCALALGVTKRPPFENTRSLFAAEAGIEKKKQLLQGWILEKVTFGKKWPDFFLTKLKCHNKTVAMLSIETPQ